MGVVDSSHIRALQGGLTGPSPVDRSRVGFKHHLLVDAAGDDNRPPAVNLFGAATANGFDSTRIGDWYGFIGGRLGVAFDRVLLYAKGGAAFVWLFSLSSAVVYAPVVLVVVIIEPP